MGFLVIPSLLLHAAVLVACIKNTITWALQLVGLAEILEPETSASFSRQETDCNSSAEDEIIREWLLPVTTFGEFVQRFHGGVAEDDELFGEVAPSTSDDVPSLQMLSPAGTGNGKGRYDGPSE